MLLALEKRLRAAISAHLAQRFGVDPEVVVELPKRAELGDLALPVCFGLAKILRRAPRQIAQELVDSLPPIPGIRSLEVAGGGYINVRFDRAAYALAAFAGAESGADDGAKAIVEHTNINPNKAAHIGHLRNAVLGDTLVRMLRTLGRRVEVQNYIDNTGVQVADVVAAFHFLKKMRPEAVRRLIHEPEAPFDYYCWDLYAEISKRYKEDADALEWRADTLRALESGEGELAELGALVSDAIVASHLATMKRLDVAYDVLPRESEILKLQFWSTAFELLKARRAIYRETAGKNVGCWVMPGELFRSSGEEKVSGPPRRDSDAESAKVIVRSNGTVTYVGKDIAYQLWKFGLLEGKDFQYVPLAPGARRSPWVTAADTGSPEAPAFGAASEVYNVIDVRQSYLQDVVRAALEALGFKEQAARSIHFAYEMVALTPRCCAELGIELEDDERAKPYVEVSGRKGLGVKADDLLDLLTETAFDEVSSRHEDLAEPEQREIAEQIAVGALRYFMLRFTRNTVIAFDFQEALAFEGETGPYLQYAAVRARNILRNCERAEGDGKPGAELPAREVLERQLEDEQLWQLVLVMSRSRWVVARAVEAGEPAQLARHAFQAAQAFSNFYHRTHVLHEEDPERRAVQLAVVRLTLEALSDLMRVMGMPVPERM